MLHRIKVSNFKSLKNVDLECGYLNILTGINGMGKSSFIQTLLLLRQSFLAGDFKKDKKIISLRGKYVSIGTFQDVIFQDFEKNQPFIHFELETTQGSFAIKTADYGDNQVNNAINVELKNVIPETEALFALRKFQYLKAERLGDILLHNTSSEQVQEKDFGKNGEYAVHFFMENSSENIKIDALRHQAGGLSLKEQLNAWLSEITPNVQVVTEYLAGRENVALYFQFFTNNLPSNKFKPQNVGFGLSYVFSVLLAILTAEPDDLLIIENPESHLHPKAQSKLAELMCLAAQNGVQIFCETHSDHIFYGTRVAIKESKIEPENVKTYYFEKEQNETQVHSIQLNKKGRMVGNVPDGFFDQYEINLDKLL